MIIQDNHTAAPKTITKYILTTLYILFLLCMGFYAYKKPAYNWDALPYMGVVLSYDSNNPNFIHDTVYKIAKQEMPAEAYDLLTDGFVDYRKRMASNAIDFYDQFPFYIVKPLYTGLVYLFYKSGFSLFKATVIPSILAYIALGILVWVWLKKYLQLFFACIICVLMMLCGPVLNVLKVSSPDCLAAFLLLSALYFIVEKQSLTAAFVFLLLSVFARLDNIIPCFLIISMLLLTHKRKEKLQPKRYLLMLLVMTICCLLITSQAVKYGWGILYYPSFSAHLNTSHESSAVFSLKNYFNLFCSNLVSVFFFSYLILFMLLASIVFIEKPPFKFRNLSFEQLILLVIMVSIIVRFILQPLIADRFYIAYYLFIIILLSKKGAETEVLRNS